MGAALLPDMMGGGICVVDIEGDGDPDLFLTNTRWVYRSGEQGVSDVLLRNDGRGRFEDVSASTGILTPNYSVGCAVADIDNDGDQDIFVSGVDRPLLYVNQGDGAFLESADGAGLVHPGMGSSAAFEDFDRDGWVDLFVARYVRVTLDSNQSLENCRSEALPEVCPLLPGSFEPLPNLLYRNRGNGTFEDVSARVGISERVDRSLAISWNDFDRDGDADLYIANDRSEPNVLYVNQGDGTFVEQAASFGVAVKASGVGDAGMGVDFSDVDLDGDWDFFVTNGPPEGSTLYVRLKDGTYLDGSEPVGFAEWTASSVAFGVVFGDFDLDGWPDLAVANGGVIPPPFNSDPALPELFHSPFKQANLLFRNRSGRGFDPWLTNPPFDLDPVESSRGLASTDLDNDGDLDLVIANLGTAPTFAENTSPSGSWLKVKLEGRTSNRSAIGAEIEVRSGGRKWLRRVTGGSSYLSQADLVQHIGLGDSNIISEISIRWPSGRRQVVLNPEKNRTMIIEESDE